MNLWAVLFFALIIGALILYIFMGRNFPEQTDKMEDAVEGWWQRLLDRFRR